jgi:ESS family glutamate:Na+ symporter
MEIYQFSERQTIIIAILVLYLGKYLSKNIKFLQDYNIPDAVTGGVLASLFFGLVLAVFQWQLEFTLNIRDALLIIFFTNG